MELRIEETVNGMIPFSGKPLTFYTRDAISDSNHKYG